MILVTGVTGFLGSFLARELIHRGESVRAIRRGKSSLELVSDVSDKIDWVEADVLDTPALEDAFSAPIDRVYHCAALVSHRRKDASGMMRTNVEGTANVINMCLAHGVRKMLYVSSIAALGRSGREQVIDERHEWEKSRYNSPYGLSKFRGEREVWRGTAEGLEAVIVNPSVILGPGQWITGTGRMFAIVDKGLTFYPPNATGFVDVRDVVECMIRLMEADITDQRFIINAENRTMKDVLGMIALSLGKEPPRIRAGSVMLRAALLREWLRELTGKYPRYTNALARLAFTSYKYDNFKVSEALGFGFRELEETIDWVVGEWNQQIPNFTT